MLKLTIVLRSCLVNVAQQISRPRDNLFCNLLIVFNILDQIQTLCIVDT